MQTCLFFSFLARQPPRPSLTLLTLPLPGPARTCKSGLQATHSMPLYPSFQGASENLGTSPVTSLAGHGTWGHDELPSPCGYLCTSPAELLGLQRSCCGGCLAAQAPSLGCRCCGRWPVWPHGSLPALALGYGSGAVGSGSHAACRVAAAGLIFTLCFGSCCLQSQHQKSRGKRSYLVKENSKHFQ